MQRLIGTHARSIRAPIISEGDDLITITVDSVLRAAESGGYAVQDRDVIGVTESLLARSQGNYIDISDIAREAEKIFPGNSFAVMFPILSRNRFSLILKGLAMTRKQITVMLSYPSDEVGNHLMDVDDMYAKGINPSTDVLSREEFRRLFGHSFLHPFTGLDYIDLYMELAEENNIEIILANNPAAVLDYSRDVLVASIHDRQRIKKKLLEQGGENIAGLDDLLNSPLEGRGYNPEYGLLGSNQAGDRLLKLFPRDSQQFCEQVKQSLYEKTGRQVEVLVFGDGAFKDPQGKIWELADPVVAPGFTEGLSGTPNEIKMKYIADNELAGLSSEEAEAKLREAISRKGSDLLGEKASLGTTPRQLSDLLGTLCDLMSGSGDKGTPIIHIQGYFDNFASS